MKKLMIISFLTIQFPIVIGMDVKKEIEKVKKIELVRQIFKKRESMEMSSSESITQSDDDMSLDRSGSFSTLVSKPLIIQKLGASSDMISHQSYSPSQKVPSNMIIKWEMYKHWDNMPEIQKELMQELKYKLGEIES